MKTVSLLLIPSLSVLVSACAPVGPGYGPGYHHDTVYVEGQSGYGYGYNQGYDHRGYNDNSYNRDVTNVNDVNVNRTNINDRTVNRTNVNDTSVNRTNVNSKYVKSRHGNQNAQAGAVHREGKKMDNNNQDQGGNQQGQPHP